MKPTIVSKAFAWLLILSHLFCPALKAFPEGITDDAQEFPAFTLIQQLHQDDTPFGYRIQESLYGIGERFSIMSRRHNMQNGIDALDALSLEALTDQKLKKQFQDLFKDIHALHGFLDEAYENEILQSQAATLRHLRNLTYGDRFAIPLIGATGAATGYGTAVVRARLMQRFIELLGASLLGELSSKMGKALPHVIIGVFSAILLGSIYYHWRKYNKLWLKNAVDKELNGIEKQVKKRIDKLEKSQTKTIKTLTDSGVKRDEKFNKRITTLEEHKQQIAPQIMKVLANQHDLEKGFIKQLNPLTQALNGSLGLLTLMMANVSPDHPSYQETLDNKQTIITALAAMNRELTSLQANQEARNKPGFSKKMKKFLTIGRRKNRSQAGSASTSNPLALSLPPRDLRSPSPGVTITIQQTPRGLPAPDNSGVRLELGDN